MNLVDAYAQACMRHARADIVRDVVLALHEPLDPAKHFVETEADVELTYRRLPCRLSDEYLQSLAATKSQRT